MIRNLIYKIACTWYNIIGVFERRTNMKKITILCALVMLLGMFPVHAENEIDVNITDVAGDVITVSGNAPIDTMVTVIILNPGKTLEDIDYSISSENSDIVQAIKPVLSAKGVFSCDVKNNALDGGGFTAIAQVKDKRYAKTFTFYPYSRKSEYVTTLKNATDAEVLKVSIDEIMTKYGLENHIL